MPTETTFVKYEDPNRKKNQVPVTTEWNGVRMVRGHSIQSAVKEILALANDSEVANVCIVGDRGKGKTTLAKTIGHLCHKLSETPYAVKIFDRENLTRFKETLSTLEPINHVLVFDDVSFLNASTSGRQITQIEKEFTEIRHLPGGQDVKIITIFIIHYTMSLKKYLRQADFYFFVTVGTNEIDNMQKIVGSRYVTKLKRFDQIRRFGHTFGKFSIPLGEKGKVFSYKYKDPFVPILFFNNTNLRYIVNPRREWIDSVCSVCSNAENPIVKSDVNLENFVNDMNYKFGIQTARTAVRIKCFQNGVNVYPKRVRQAMKYLENYMKAKNFNIEELAEKYNFNSDRTRLDKKLPIEKENDIL